MDIEKDKGIWRNVALVHIPRSCFLTDKFLLKLNAVNKIFFKILCFKLFSKQKLTFFVQSFQKDQS